MFDSNSLLRRALLYVALPCCFLLGALASAFLDVAWQTNRRDGSQEVIKIGDFDGIDISDQAHHVTASQ